MYVREGGTYSLWLCTYIAYTYMCVYEIDVYRFMNTIK